METIPNQNRAQGNIFIFPSSGRVAELVIRRERPWPENVYHPPTHAVGVSEAGDCAASRATGRAAAPEAFAVVARATWLIPDV